MSNNLSNIKERILHIADNLDITKASFFKKIDITYGNFTGDKKNRPINSDALANILREHPNINAEWLITGEGEMFKTRAPKGEQKADNSPNTLPIADLQKLFQLMEDKIMLLEENRRQTMEIQHLEEELLILKGQKSEQKQHRHKLQKT